MSSIFSVQKLRNVFVTNNCVIIDKGTVLKASCVGEEYYQKYLKFKFRLKYFFPIFSCPKKSYILATDEWSKNYCHWFWEALTKVIILKKETPDATLLLPKSYLKIDFVTKSLAAFGFTTDNIKTIPKKSQLWVKNLSFIPCINIGTSGYYDFLKFAEIGQALVSHYQDQFKTNFGERIYISRSNPEKDVGRKVQNESELVAMLARHGFKTIYMEKFSFLEQISIANSAKFIVASHGAGITNVMFAKENSHLLELVNYKWGKTCFAQMCERMNSTYHRFDCAEIASNKNIEIKDVSVDVKNLEENLIKILP